MKTKIILILSVMFLMFNISFSAPVKNRKRSTVSIKQQIRNTSWKLIRISDDDLSKKGITLNLTEKEISGKSGVNNYFGTYRINGNRISVSKLGITAMIGSTDRMEDEETFIDILENVKRIELKGDKLILRTELAEVLTFVRDIDSEPIPYNK